MNDKLREIIIEVEDARRALNDEVAHLAQAQLDFRSSPQSWSTGEILDHLHLIESSVVNLIAMSAEKAKGKGLGPDLTGGSALGSLDHFPVERPSRKVQAPSAVIPRPDVARSELLGALSASRAQLLEAIAAAARVNAS